MTLLSFAAPFTLLVLGFAVSVSAGAARDTDLLSPVSPLTAFLTAALLFALQAVLWVRLGATL